MSLQEFKDYLTNRGVDIDTLTNEEKRVWSEKFDKSRQASGNFLYSFSIRNFLISFSNCWLLIFVKLLEVLPLLVNILLSFKFLGKEVSLIGYLV